MCARQPAARGGWGRTCQRRMCVLFALILGTARGAPQRGERGVPEVVFPKRRGVLGRPVSVRAGHLPPPPRTGGGQRHGPLPVPCSPSPRGRRRAGVCRQGGRLPPSGKGLVATAMSQATQLVTPTSKEPKAGVSHRRERQPPGRPGPEGTIRSAGPLDKGPGDHEVTLSVRRSPFLILR